jgi:hypothetical protein
MNPGPLSKVLRVVRKITQETDRSRLVDLVNETLEMMYRDPNIMWNYFQTDGCTIIRPFVEPCRNSRSGAQGFKAVVMPCGVKNVRELRVDGTPYKITEERVDPVCFPNGRMWTNRAHNQCDPQAEHLPVRLLEADIPACGDSGTVMFQSDCSEDCGLLVGTRYLDNNLTEQREDIELGPNRTGTSVSVNQFLEITFPERMGYLAVSTDNGFPLGKYHPSTLLPVHEWFRLAVGCVGQKVTYRGLKELTPVVFDTDPVPFTDTYLWELALKAREHSVSMELTRAQDAGLTRIFAQLARAGESDLSSHNDNNNQVVVSRSAKTMLSTSRVLQPRRLSGYNA